MSYIGAGASIFEWFPHRPSAAKLHPLPAMWLTPLRGLSLVPPLSKRARTRLQSDDVEMEGSTPEVFPGTDCPPPHTSLAMPPVAPTSVGIYHADVERAMPTPPVSPGSNRSSMASSAGGSPQRPSRSPQHLSPQHDADLVSPNPFPRSSGLLKAALVPTPPGTPKRHGRVNRSPTGPVPQPPVAPAADAEAQARALSPLAPRVWSPKPARKDPLSDWGYTNPKPPSTTTPAGLQMDVGAFPTGSAAAVHPHEAVATTPPKPVAATAAAAAAPSAGRSAFPVFGQPMSPEQRARAKLMLEGRIVYCRDGDGGAPVPARSMAPTTIVVSTPVPTAAACADMVMDQTSSDLDEVETDPETDVDGAECPKPLSATASSYEESTYALPGLTADGGNTAAAADAADPELGLGMFDWDYSLATAPDNVPRVPDLPVAPTPAVAVGARVVSGSRYRDGFGYGYGDTSVGTDGPGAASVPSAATQQQQQQQRRRRLEDVAAVTHGMVAAVPEHDVEETAWGYRVPDTGRYVDHYSVSATSLGWDGCYYGSGAVSDGWSAGSSPGSTSPMALEAAMSAVTVRGDANLSMGIIYDLV